MLEFKGMQIASLWDLYQSFGRPALEMLRRGNGRAAETKPADASAGTETLKENAAQLGELYALIAWLSSMQMDDGKSILDYRAKGKGEIKLFPMLITALPPGAVKSLMRTVAVEVMTVRTKETTGFTRHADPKDPAKPGKETPVVSEGERKFNEKGPQVIGALTWLIKNQNEDTDEKKVEAVAKILIDLRLLENFEDKRDAAVKKAAKTLGDLKEAGLKWWYDGYRDTWIQIKWAGWVLGDDAAMKEILTSDPALEYWNSFQLEDNNPEQARVYLERLQGYVWDEVERRKEEREAAEQSPAHRRFKWLPSQSTIIIWGSLGVFLLLIAMTQHFKSLGT